MASVTVLLLLSSFWTRFVRCAAAYSRGVRPETALKMRWKWWTLRPTAFASLERLGVSSAASIIRHLRHLGRMLLLRRGLIRLASFARPKAGLLGIGTRQMEANVFRVG